MTMIVTHQTGGRTMPISMTVCQSHHAMTETELNDAILPGSGLNVPFIAGTMSAFVAHERAGAALYRVAAEQSQNPALVARYEEFGRETAEHIDIYENLIRELGGDPQYVSPAARMTEQLGSKLLEGPVLLAGSVDVVSFETALLEAVVIAEHKCRDNWQLLGRLAEVLPEGAARRAVVDAVATVRSQEDEHVAWASNMWFELALTNARHPVASKTMGAVEGVLSKVKEALT
jgi:rubrerythrin